MGYYVSLVAAVFVFWLCRRTPFGARAKPMMREKIPQRRQATDVLAVLNQILHVLWVWLVAPPYGSEIAGIAEKLSQGGAAVVIGPIGALCGMLFFVEWFRLLREVTDRPFLQRLLIGFAVLVPFVNALVYFKLLRPVYGDPKDV